jgi:hypothetical protein
MNKKIEEDFEAFKEGVKRLKELKKELDSIKTNGKFKKEKNKINSKLKSVYLIPIIEKEIYELKRKINGDDIKEEKKKFDVIADLGRKLRRAEAEEEKLRKEEKLLRLQLKDKTKQEEALEYKGKEERNIIYDLGKRFARLASKNRELGIEKKKIFQREEEKLRREKQREKEMLRKKDEEENKKINDIRKKIKEEKELADSRIYVNPDKQEIRIEKPAEKNTFTLLGDLKLKEDFFKFPFRREKEKRYYKDVKKEVVSDTSNDLKFPEIPEKYRKFSHELLELPKLPDLPEEKHRGFNYNEFEKESEQIASKLEEREIEKLRREEKKIEELEKYGDEGAYGLREDVEFNSNNLPKIEKKIKITEKEIKIIGDKKTKNHQPKSIYLEEEKFENIASDLRESKEKINLCLKNMHINLRNKREMHNYEIDKNIIFSEDINKNIAKISSILPLKLE